ncbi:MAG: hypothetical protein EHM57_02025 [Actinobacteria bacterium]|nr:MAG: hypothetical protein EHM57_02025 [Actinomycetota bacterium]
MAPERAVDPAVLHAPSPERRPVEAIIGVNIAKRAIWVAPLVIALFWVLRGPGGAAAAAIGIGIVVANFVLGGWILAVAAGISLSLYHAAALFGFLIRLGLITLTMTVITRLTEIDRMAMGISTVASYLLLVSIEAIAIVRGGERDLQWTS